MLIAGLHGHICSDCATQAHRIIAEEVKEEKNEKPIGFKNYKPVEIKKHLDEYIIGQEEAKKVLSVAVYNHYKRLSQKPTNSKKDDVEIEKSNVIMVGEIRDSETLEMAMEAAMTGHLVFSTIHTNSSAETITRVFNL